MFRFLFVLILAIFNSNGASIPGLKSGLAPRLDGRIVGGIETKIEDFAYQIALLFFGSHRCGGSIIKPNVILTACHCVLDISPNYLVVRSGATSRFSGGLEHPIKEIISHEDFDPYEYHNDVAIMILNKPMDFSNVRQPIALARKGEKLRGGTKAIVSGWGSLSQGGNLPENLQYVAVPIVSNVDCAKAYEDVNPVSDSMLCAGETYGGRDACQGDSGGPLIVGGKLYGIVSWGLGCALANYPGAYADVGYLREWIDEKTLIANL